MKIYTRTGDGGETGLLGGARVPKGHVRIEACGTVDELNAALGVGREAVADQEIKAFLGELQQDLFRLGAVLATPDVGSPAAGFRLPPFPEERVGQMERWIDESSAETPELRGFILPGGTPGAGFLHLARTVCRRAERAVVRLNETEAVAPLLVRYLNRLSDLLFSLARLENWRQGVPDILWDKGEG